MVALAFASVAEHGTPGGGGVLAHPLWLGGNVFGWSADEAASFAVLDAYREGGGTAVDTANSYSAWAPGNRGGESEEIIGRWLASRGGREAMTISTKVGYAFPGQDRGTSRPLVRRALQGSLRRLGTEYVDVYFAHIEDPATPLAETLGALSELVDEGLVRAVGVSQYRPDTLRAAVGVVRRDGLAPVVVLQTGYNLMERGFEAELGPVCRDAGVGVTPYYALARGFLSGKYRRGRPLPASVRAAGVVASYLDDRGDRVLAALDRVAAGRDATPAQVALAWLAARPTVLAPVASATTPGQVRELLAAVDIRLDDEEVAILDAAS
jgi:aryl-alcohol dehydrogenase-like predicted oxidoreductase